MMLPRFDTDTPDRPAPAGLRLAARARLQSHALTRRPALLALLAAALALPGPTPAVAQPPGAQPGAEHGPPQGDIGPLNPRRAARRERLRQRIRAMRAWYLTQELELDEATADRLFPVLGRFDDRLDQVQQRGVQLRRALRRETRAPRPDPRAINRLVDDLLVHYEDLYRVQRDRLAAARRVVSPVQHARLILLLPEIDDAVRRQLQRALRGVKNPDAPGRFRRGLRKNRAHRRGGPVGEPDSPPFDDPF